jgi:hypothetical protein
MDNNRPFVNDGPVLGLDHTFTLPWLASGKDLIGKCHSKSNPDAGSKTGRHENMPPLIERSAL